MAMPISVPMTMNNTSTSFYFTHTIDEWPELALEQVFIFPKVLIPLHVTAKECSCEAINRSMGTLFFLWINSYFLFTFSHSVTMPQSIFIPIASSFLNTPSYLSLHPTPCSNPHLSFVFHCFQFSQYSH